MSKSLLINFVWYRIPSYKRFHKEKIKKVRNSFSAEIPLDYKISEN